MAFVKYVGTRNLIAAHQPIELVTNGGFDSDSSWNKGSGWSIGSGVASAVSGVASDLQQDFPLSQGLNYSLIYTLSGVSAGSLQPLVKDTAGVSRTANGTFNDVIQAGVGVIALELRKDSSFVGSVDNVSLQLGANQWDLDFYATALNPIKRTPKTVHEALDGTPETLADDMRERYAVTTEPMVYGSTTWLQWMEFLNSVREGEQFTFDPYGLAATPIDSKTAMLDGDWVEQRGNRDNFKISFTVRIL